MALYFSLELTLSVYMKEKSVPTIFLKAGNAALSPCGFSVFKGIYYLPLVDASAPYDIL